MSILAIRSNRRQVGKQFQCLHISLCSRPIEVNLWVQVRTGRTTVTTCKCLIRRLPKQSLRLDSLKLRRRYRTAIVRHRDPREPPGGGEGRGYSTNVYSTGRLRPKVQPLTLLPFFTKKVPLSYTFY